MIEFLTTEVTRPCGNLIGHWLIAFITGFAVSVIFYRRRLLFPPLPPTVRLQQEIEIRGRRIINSCEVPASKDAEKTAIRLVTDDQPAAEQRADLRLVIGDGMVRYQCFNDEIQSWVEAEAVIDPAGLSELPVKICQRVQFPIPLHTVCDDPRRKVNPVIE